MKFSFSGLDFVHELTSISCRSFSDSWEFHGEMWNLMLQMKLQFDLEIFSSFLASPTIFKMIWLFLNAVGKIIIFGNNNILFSRQSKLRQVEIRFLELSANYDGFLISFHEIFAYFKWNYIIYFVHHLWLIKYR